MAKLSWLFCGRCPAASKFLSNCPFRVAAWPGHPLVLPRQALPGCKQKAELLGSLAFSNSQRQAYRRGTVPAPNAN